MSIEPTVREEMSGQGIYLFSCGLAHGESSNLNACEATAKLYSTSRDQKTRPLNLEQQEQIEDLASTAVPSLEAHNYN